MAVSSENTGARLSKLVAVEQEVVAHRQQHVHVRFEREARQQLREPLLRFRQTLREQLLELIEDQQRMIVPAAPARDDVDGDARLLEVDQPRDGLGIARQLRRERVREGGERPIAWRRRRSHASRAARSARAPRAGTSSCPRPTAR